MDEELRKENSVSSKGQGLTIWPPGFLAWVRMPRVLFGSAEGVSTLTCSTEPVDVAHTQGPFPVEEAQMGVCRTPLDMFQRQPPKGSVPLGGGVGGQPW